MRTRLNYLIAIIAVTAILASCKKEPTACFTFTSESIEDEELTLALEEIEFTNCSEEADSYEWDFGDDETSTKTNPEHAYEEPGEYTITLTATNDDGTNTVSQEIEIEAPPPTACFTMTSASIDDEITVIAGEEIDFENCSEFATEYSWDFGDGEDSDDENPAHAFSQGGTYTVTLTATGDGGSNSTSRNIEVADLDGTWSGSITIGSDAVPCVWELEQDSSDLTGTCDDGYGPYDLTSASNVDGHYVKIVFIVPSTSGDLQFNLTGEINDDVDEMDGTFTVTGYTVTGPWIASKTSKKSAILNNTKGLEDIIKQVRK